MSLTVSTPRDEERAARERQRRIDRLQRANAAKRERDAKSKLAQIIREERARPRARHCRCGLRVGMSWKQVKALGTGCTAGSAMGKVGQPGYVCPTLDAVRRRYER